MPFMNLDKLKQKKAECSAAIVTAMKEQNESKLDAALDGYSQFIGEAVQTEIMAAGNGAVDTVVLASRGIRQLTQAETNFYDKFIAAAKAPNPKQAIESVNEAIPVTVIDTVVEDIRKAHPLLDRINFRNTSLYTKYIYNKTSKPAAVWGKVTSAITNELEGNIDFFDVELKKLTAFMYIPKDMLDLGPAWVDRFVRELLSEFIALSVESAVVDGDGNDKYIGMTRDVSDTASVVGGVYPRKTAVKLSKLSPAVLGGILAEIAKNIDGTARPVVNPIFVVNPFDYFRKVMPATTVLGMDGTYRNDVLPYPMQIIQSAAIEEGSAVIGLPERYFAGIGMSKDGKIEYSDEYKFLEDNRTYSAKFTGNGRPLDNNAFVLCDVSEHAAAALEVVVVDKSGKTDGGTEITDPAEDENPSGE